MEKVKILSIILLLLFLGNFIIQCDFEGFSPNKEDKVISFTNSYFENTIRKTIKKEEGAIYESDFKNLKQLWLVGSLISDLSDIKYCINLEVLILNNNFGVKDISLLGKLTKLKYLTILGDNELNINISALSNLKNLVGLELINIPIKDVSPLSELVNLQVLNLLVTDIKDISILSNLTKLETFRLYNSPVSDISILSNFTKLEELSLSNNCISDISMLSKLTKLRELQLDDNQINDISSLLILYENGGLHKEDSAIVISNNNMNIRSGTRNRDIVEFLVEKGVNIEWKEGNITD